MRWRKIFPIGTVAVLVTLTISGATCPRERPVDVSQRVLIESGKALSSVDSVVARNITKASNEALELVQDEYEMFEQNTEACLHDMLEMTCPALPDPMAMYEFRMESWAELTAALESMSQLLNSWERLNDIWRDSGNRPSYWERVVCTPFRDTIEEIETLLEMLDIRAPQLWQSAVSMASEICMLGAVPTVE